MANHRLGMTDEARAAMNRTRELMSGSEAAEFLDAQAFPKEAEAVLKEPAGKRDIEPGHP
jgi:hypothetical protein